MGGWGLLPSRLGSFKGMACQSVLTAVSTPPHGLLVWRTCLRNSPAALAGVLLRHAFLCKTVTLLPVRMGDT